MSEMAEGMAATSRPLPAAAAAAVYTAVVAMLAREHVVLARRG